MVDDEVHTHFNEELGGMSAFVHLCAARTVRIGAECLRGSAGRR